MGNTVMASGNRGFAKGLANVVPPPSTGVRLPPRTGILDARGNRLAELAAGHSTTRVHELVDPARCRIWDAHNRDYAALDHVNCADLIESFKAQGRQEVPAIVRRVQGDPPHVYEVICGARRHWTVSWMRAHNYSEFKFLIEPRELTDEEAFRLADLENRSRLDLSDYERAVDYARAIERFYGGSQQRMAERLEVTRSWLSRYLELAKLPAEVVDSFGTSRSIGISHAAVLGPHLRAPLKRERVVVEARVLATEQAELSARGAPLLPPPAVMQRLTRAGKSEAPSGQVRRIKVLVIRAPDGAILAQGERAARGGGLTIKVPAASKHERSVLMNAVNEILDRTISGAQSKAVTDDKGTV